MRWILFSNCLFVFINDHDKNNNNMASTAFLCHGRLHTPMKLNSEFNERFMFWFHSLVDKIHHTFTHNICLKSSTIVTAITSSSSTKMAAIKIFQTVQRFFTTLGLYWPQSNQIQPFNMRILYFSTFVVLNTSSLLGYLLFEAKAIQVCYFCHFFFSSFWHLIERIFFQH